MAAMPVANATASSASSGEPAEVTIGVRPQERCHGIDTALAAAVLDVLGRDVTLPCEVYDGGGVQFAEAPGLEARHREERLLRAPPVDTAALRVERAISERLTFTSFVGSPAADLAPHWDALAAQMADDVPLGGLTRPGKRDGDARRREDERHVEGGPSRAHPRLARRTAGRARADPAGERRPADRVAGRHARRPFLP